MSNKVITIASLVALLGLSTVLISHAAIATSDYNNNGKVTICHRNDDAKNPYVQEQPDADGVISGHDDHNGPVATSLSVAEALKDAQTKWGDIIPPFTYQYCSGGGYDLTGSVCIKKNQPNQTPVTVSYLGKNWTTDGQTVWNNSCNMPAPTATPTPTPTPTMQPTATPTTTLDCDGDTDGDQPNADDICNDTDDLTPTPTTVDCDRDGDVNDPHEAEECATVTPTATPTATVTSTPTPTATPTPGNNNSGGSGGGDGRSDGLSSCPSCTQAPQSSNQAVLGASTGPQQGVLGASTMASTGTFEENAMNLLAGMGILLMGISTAYGKFYKKAFLK